jgi:hypothetical protein
VADVQLTVQVSQPNRVDVTLDSPNIVQVQQAAPTRLEVIQGVSLPAGGNVNQVLTKLSNTNFDYIWTTPAAGGGGTVSNLSNGSSQLALAANGKVSLANGTSISDTGGPVTQLTISNASMRNAWVNGTYTVTFGNDIVCSITLIQPSYYNILRVYNFGSNHFVDETFTIPGTTFGAASPADDMYIRIISVGSGLSITTTANTWTFGNDGSLTVPYNGVIKGAGTNYDVRLGDGLSIGQGGSLANYRNESWALYGQNSDAGTQILLPGQADSDNGRSLLIQHLYTNSSIDIECSDYLWSFTSNGQLRFPDGATYSDGTLTINSSYAINAASEINSFLNWRTANQSGVQIYNDGVNIFANEPTQVGWKFNSTGELVFPNSTRQNTAWLGYDPNSSLAFNKANSANLVAVSAFAKANSANYYAYLVDANVTASFAKANSANYYAYLVDANATAAFAAANVAAQTVPQNAQSGVYALQRSDAGKHIYYTQATSTILYIPTTANVAFANGTTIMLISRTTSSANVTVTPNSGVTMYLAGNTTSASRNLTTYGMATLIQVAANTWMINGTGVV